MPHDKNGKKVETGQTVSVRFKVLSVTDNDEFCNAQLETVEPMFPAEYGMTLTVNTRQVEVEE